MSEQTAGDLITAARLEHALFNHDRHRDVVLLSHLSGRYRVLLKELSNVIKDRVSQATTVASKVSNQLVGVDASGNPYTFATSGDGYSVIQDTPSGTGPVYLSPEKISYDPSSSGFPLPSDSLQLVDIYATLTDGVKVPVKWRPQQDLSKLTGLSGLIATVNGWRLLPVKNPADLTTFWDQVSSVTVVYIADPGNFTALTDSVSQVPSIYHMPLQYALCEHMALREASEEKPLMSPKLVDYYVSRSREEWARVQASAMADHQPLKTITTKRNR